MGFKIDLKITKNVLNVTNLYAGMEMATYGGMTACHFLAIMVLFIHLLLPMIKAQNCLLCNDDGDCPTCFLGIGWCRCQLDSDNGCCVFV